MAPHTSNLWIISACLISIPLDPLALQVDHTAFDTPADCTENEGISRAVHEMLISTIGLTDYKESRSARRFW
jgi:hypothetical protein